MGRGNYFSSSVGLVLFFVQFVVVLPQYNYAKRHQQTCVPSFCGKITNISYPFRLKGDPESCGDPMYELGCENNVTVLSLFSVKYYVKAINYKNFTLRLVDPGIREADCSSIPIHNLSASDFPDTYDYHQYLAYPYEATQLLDGPNIFIPVIYLKCSNPVRDDRQYVDTSPCLNLHSKGHVYAVLGDLWVGDLRVDCRVIRVAATSFNFSYDDYGWYQWDINNRTYSYAEIHAMLVYGFDVSWMGRVCLDRCGSHSDCYFNETARQSLKCRTPSCYSPLGFGISCFGNRLKSKLRIFVEDVIYGIAKGLLQIVGFKTTNEGENIADFHFAIKIGSVIGKFILPESIIMRFILGIVFFILLIHTCRRRHTSIYDNIEDFLQGNTLIPIRYSYKEIKKMTRNFKDKLGEGGYGSVYKGKLRSGPFVAIKILCKPKANGQEFISEVATIGRIHHANVVQLIGFCVEGSKRALVYEFMPNGSLDKYIFSNEGSSSLTYDQIYKISLGVAHGIAYLHEGCDMQILHFDIKPHNILLDENFIPKVSDFGLAKLYPIDNSIVTLTNIRGTIGYMAPELFYKNIGGVSYKADVYSFGMLLMEMTSRRRNLNPHADQSCQIFFPFWIYNQLIEEKDIEIEEFITDKEKENVKKMFVVALWCIQLKPNERPSMSKVIKMLEGNIENIEMPPKPSLYPTEISYKDLEVNSEQTELVGTVSSLSSLSYPEETIVEPLINNST